MCKLNLVIAMGLVFIASCGGASSLEPRALPTPTATTSELPISITDGGTYIWDSETKRLFKVDEHVDGSLVAITHCCGDPDYYTNIMNPATGETVRLIDGNIQGPVWSPDGQQLAFSI